MSYSNTRATGALRKDFVWLSFLCTWPDYKIGDLKSFYSPQVSALVAVLELATNRSLQISGWLRKKEEQDQCISIISTYLKNWGVGGTVANESALRSAGTLRLRVRARPPGP
ncbi:hypothetical protein PoB_007278300 [Plakobranchus ocellatus]|uniref:Uncharacterized protein n=1 Tax=Plakobranchus ocellatus TaxID=259542 RepID=A0AAV4DPM5_9GAST|nr:hypothetical protein PoB_007278300 [Plakobranchus ocellatus]